MKIEFEERDIAFIKKLTTIKQEMQSRGTLSSSMTITHCHQALINELAESRHAIASAHGKCLRIKKPLHIPHSKLTNEAIVHLNERRSVLEQLYLENIKPQMKSIQNQKMLEGCVNLTDVIDLHEHELRDEMIQIIDEYLALQGKTLYHRIVNRFLDRPLVAFAIIVLLILGAIMTISLELASIISGVLF